MRMAVPLFFDTSVKNGINNGIAEVIELIFLNLVVGRADKDHILSLNSLAMAIDVRERYLSAHEASNVVSVVS